MRANSFPGNALAEIRTRDPGSKSGQGIDTTAVAPEGIGENARKSEDELRPRAANPSLDQGMQAAGRCAAHSGLSKILAVNDLRGSEAGESGDKSEKNGRRLIARSTLLRWCTFNLVGGMGIIVQFAALFLLKRILHFNYLAATTIAVEAAVVHNFVWHEQFTWADRTRPDRTTADRVQPAPDASEAEAQNSLSRRFAALKRCATQRLCSGQAKSLRPRLRRLVRFNLTTGAVSILGNLALMRVMVGQGHMNYLLANAIAISLCSLANFLVSKEWVFKRVGAAD